MLILQAASQKTESPDRKPTKYFVTLVFAKEKQQIDPSSKINVIFCLTPFPDEITIRHRLFSLLSKFELLENYLFRVSIIQS